MRGIAVTDGVDFNNAQPLDFVMDSRLRGGLKISKKLFINPATDMQFLSGFFYYGVLSHGLPFTPGTICFQDGLFGNGWQNEADIFRPSVNADNQNIYFITESTTPLCIIIFDEKVAP